jgi:hypothetical protein
VAELPIEFESLVALLARLEAADLLLPTFESTRDQIYSIQTYLVERSLHTATIDALLDRNVLSCVLDLEKGGAASEQHRDAAALMAFLQCFDMRVDPALALYEYAAPHGSESSQAQLRLLRAADNRDPKDWTSIALGRTEALSVRSQSTEVSAEDPIVDFVMPLMRWRRNYVHCLKIAEIELQGGPAKKRMDEYLDWAFRIFQLGGPPIGLASLLFAPNAPRRGLLQGLRSANRVRALESVRRTTWDMTLVSRYVEAIQRQVEHNHVVFLCSFDAGLKRVARGIAGSPEDIDTFWTSLWGARLGSEYRAKIAWMYDNLDHPSRPPVPSGGSWGVDDFIRVGEGVVTDWRAHA